MIQLCNDTKDSSFTPDKSYIVQLLVHMQNVINLISRQLLNEMIQFYSETNDINIKPNTITYNTVINAYTRINKPEMALQLLNEIIQIYNARNDHNIKPDTIS